MRKLRIGFALLGVLGIFSETLQAQDVFSVNFYAFGKTRDDGEWGLPESQETITLEEDESAGVGAWNTTGWDNIVVPWNPSQPQDPVTITSNQGSTATFTLIDARNGAPYHWVQTRDSSTWSDGNATLLDGHANGTGDPGDGSKIFDMEVSDIPFDVYDVIIYLGINEGQRVDGTGRIVFNGDEQDFTMFTSEPDGTLTEIVDSTTPGNYIVFEGVSGSSFDAQVWGIGDAHVPEWVHVGPAGFQIAPSVAEGALQAGDADMDCDFDQLDLVRVQQGGKYLTGQDASWGEGDWNGAPGGSVADQVPPPGDGLFDQLDIIAALGTDLYLQGSYCADGGAAALAIPEPSTPLLLAFGLTGTLLGWRRRRR